MLTPDYLNLIEFNNVVKIYEQLNIDIVVDIIKRVSKSQDITSTTMEQLKILKQTNGSDIFNKTLERTSLLTTKTKKELRKLFKDMIKEDMKGYKELYKYREKPFKLNETQYKILNQGLKKTNKILKNLTNTIAFQSKQAYVDAIDRAYMKATSGAFSYTKTINEAVQELARKGITLKDKSGRNVQLEVAVRRNVLAGIQETANNINRGIEEELGCDGYEVTAHLGARPTHAVAQGKQYAKSHRTKDSRNYPLWSDIEHLWSDYNCRHSYFGIILGISEPQYNEKELNEFKNATVILDGKEVPYYEATQKQRQIENEIRKQKRTVEILQKAQKENVIEKNKLVQLQKKYKDFCKKTGLEKDYSRIKITKTNNTTEKQKLQYKDITNKFVKTKKYRVKEQQYYIDPKGTKYKVDGKHIILEPTTREKEVANILGRIYGGQVNIIPRINEPKNIKTPDYMISNEKFDLKQITGGGKWTIEGNLKGKKEQANNFIIDITKAKIDIKEACRQIEVIYNSKHYTWVDEILLIKENLLVKVYKRD